MLEKQFHSYFTKATNMKGAAGENMLQLLERRLDNVVYRLGFGDSRAQARQIVNHGHITVNGKKVNIPSFIVKAGDVIAIAEGSTSIEKFKAMREGTAKTIPTWLELNSADLCGKVVELPKREDIDLSIEEHLIVELYSR
jgi:small subunit ribosomal protein S4